MARKPTVTKAILEQELEERDEMLARIRDEIDEAIGLEEEDDEDEEDDK